MKKRFAASVLASLVLTACGSGEEPPVEQIVVREPGQAAPVAGESAGATGDLAAAGEAAFAVCAACHAVEAGAPSGIGPNLHGVVGRAAGSLPGYSYSDAMAAVGYDWSDETLDAFLGDPGGQVPGTKMVAGAVSDADKRAAIIAYLATLSE